MSAERHALEAALSYSAKLEKQIKAMQDEIQEQRMRNNDLRGKLEGVKDAVRDRDRPTSNFSGPMCETSMPMECRPEDTKADFPRCKNCGAPI